MIFEKKIKNTYGIPVFTAQFLEAFLFVLAIFLLISTLIIPVSPVAKPALVYTRNSITVLAWGLMSGYFFLFIKVRTLSEITLMRQKRLTILTFFVCIIAIVKAVLAVINLIVYMNYPTKLVCIYYVGEVVAWFALALFFICQYLENREKASLFAKKKKAAPEHEHHHKEHNA